MNPTYTETDYYGNTYYYSDPEKSILHRVDGPAVEWMNGGKEWFINGKRHREDGPAIELSNGDKFWCLSGKQHREDGPAVEYSDGRKKWYRNGKRLTEKEFNE